MHISLDLNQPLTNVAAAVIKALAAAIDNPSIYQPANQIVSGSQPQPQVGDNSGTLGSVSSSAGDGGVSGGAVAQASEQAQSVSASPAPSASEKVKRGPKPKKEEVAAVTTGEPVGPTTSATDTAPSTTASSAPASAAADTTTLTLDDVRAKLQAFTAVKGIEAGIELLKTFDAGRISELKPAAYGEFVGKCAVEAA